MKRPHSVGTIRFRPKPSWDSTTHDLTRYRLSKDDLQSKLKSRQPKPLDQYTGPANLVRMHREDGTPYVLGKKIFEPVSAEENHVPTAKGRARPCGKENETLPDDDSTQQQFCRAYADQDGQNPRPVNRPSSVPLTAHFVGSGQTMNRHLGIATTTPAQSNGTDISRKCRPIPPAPSADQHVSNSAAVFVMPNEGREDLPHSKESSVTTSEPAKILSSHDGSDLRPKSRDKSLDLVENKVDNHPLEQPASNSILKSGALRINNNSAKTVSRAHDTSPSAQCKAKLSPDRSENINESVLSSFAMKRSIAIAKEQNREKDIALLSAACEEICTRMIQYETAPNRAGKWNAIEKRDGAAASFTEFLLRVTGRLF